MGRRDSTADPTTTPDYSQSSPQRGDATDPQGERLRSLRGAAFDTAFANAMVDAHTKAISLLELAQGRHSMKSCGLSSRARCRRCVNTSRSRNHSPAAHDRQ